MRTCDDLQSDRVAASLWGWSRRPGDVYVEHPPVRRSQHTMEGDASPVVLPNERQSSRCFRALADMAGSEHLQRLPATRRAWKSCLPLLYGLSGEDAEERKRSMSHWRGLFARVFLGNEDEGLDINTFREALKAMDRFEDLRRRKYEEIERPVLFDDIMAVDAVRDTSFWDESTEDQLARNDERLEMLDALHFKAEKRYERATLVLRKLYLDHCLKAAPFKKFQFIGHINFAFPGPQEDDTNDSYRVDFEHFQADSRGEMLNKLRKVEAALSKSKKPGKVDDTTVNL